MRRRKKAAPQQLPSPHPASSQHTPSSPIHTTPAIRQPPAPSTSSATSSSKGTSELSSAAYMPFIRTFNAQYAYVEAAPTANCPSSACLGFPPSWLLLLITLLALPAACCRSPWLVPPSPCCSCLAWCAWRLPRPTAPLQKSTTALTSCLLPTPPTQQPTPPQRQNAPSQRRPWLELISRMLHQLA